MLFFKIKFLKQSLTRFGLCDFPCIFEPLSGRSFKCKEPSISFCVELIIDNT